MKAKIFIAIIAATIITGALVPMPVALAQAGPKDDMEATPPSGEINTAETSTTSGSLSPWIQIIGNAAGMDQYRWHHQDFGWWHETFDSTGKTIISATLEIRAWDVDNPISWPEYYWERDIIYADGHKLGELKGGDGIWSVTTFNIDPAIAKEILEDAKMYLFIDIDASGPGLRPPGAWAVTIDWSRLTIVWEPEVAVTLDVDAPDEAEMGSPYDVYIEVSASDSWSGEETSVVVTEDRGPIHATWDIHNNEYWHSYFLGGEWKERPEAKCKVYVYDKVLDAWTLQDGNYEFGTESISLSLAPGETAYCYVECYHRWFWIEPWDWTRIGGIIVNLGLGQIVPGAGTALSLGKQTAEALNGQHEIVYSYTASCEGTLDEDTTTVKLPTKKYLLLGESMGLGVNASIATSLGTALLVAPEPTLLTKAAAIACFALEVGCIVGAEGKYAQASDPPDFDYKQIAVPEVPDIPDIDEIVNPEFREAAEKALELAATSMALLTSMERYDAAKIDAKPEYMTLQLEASKFYAEQMVELTAWLSEFWDYNSENIPIPTPQEIEQARQSLWQDGLPAMEVTILSIFGFTAQEMTEISQTIASLPDEYFSSPEKIGDALGIVLDGAMQYIQHIPETPPGVVLADVDIDPDTLQLKSGGNWVTCYIELPEQYDVSVIDVSSLTLQNNLYAESGPMKIGDYDYDGIPDLMVKFSRQELIQLVEPGEQIVALIGQLDDGTALAGIDVLRVIH